MTASSSVAPGQAPTRNVLVTGAGAGIGLATAQAFAAQGARVIGFDINPGPPQAALTWIECDVADESSVAAAFAQVQKVCPALDVLVNNAGIGGRGTIETATEEDWLNIFGINVFGVARVSRRALPLLRAGNTAAVVNVASTAAVIGTPMRAVYSSSKGAVAALTRAMAADLVAEGIRVNAIFPGTVHTAVTGRYDADPEAAIEKLRERQPLGHFIDVAEIARAIVFLSSPENASITGAEMRYDGGLSEVVNLGTD